MKLKIIKISLTFLFFHISIISYTQEDDFINYYRNIEKAYQKGVFTNNNDSTIHYMEAAFSYVEEPLSEDYFEMAQANLGMENRRLYYQSLLKSINAGLDSTELNKTNAYAFLNRQQKNKCIDAYENYQFEFDTLLGNEIELLRKEDIRVRTELDNFD